VSVRPADKDPEHILVTLLSDVSLVAPPEVVLSQVSSYGSGLPFPWHPQTAVSVNM